MYESSPISFILNLFEEMPDSLTNPQMKINYYSCMMVSQDSSSSILSIISIFFVRVLYPNNSFSQSNYSLNISQKSFS